MKSGPARTCSIADSADAIASKVGRGVALVCLRRKHASTSCRSSPPIRPIAPGPVSAQSFAAASDTAVGQSSIGSPMLWL